MSPHDPAELRERAGELLSRPPFTDATDGDGLIERFLDLLSRLLSAVGSMAGTPLLAWVLVALGVLVAVLIVRRTTALGGGRPAATVPDVSGRSAAGWHLEADRQLDLGRRREALRCRYRAMLAALGEAGVVGDVAARTVRELDEAVARADPGLAEEVAAAGRCLEAVVYGRREVGDDDLRVVAQAARAAGRPVRVGP